MISERRENKSNRGMVPFPPPRTPESMEKQGKFQMVETKVKWGLKGKRKQREQPAGCGQEESRKNRSGGHAEVDGHQEGTGVSVRRTGKRKKRASPKVCGSKLFKKMFTLPR